MVRPVLATVALVCLTVLDRCHAAGASTALMKKSRYSSVPHRSKDSNKQSLGNNAVLQFSLLRGNKHTQRLDVNAANDHEGGGSKKDGETQYFKNKRLNGDSIGNTAGEATLKRKAKKDNSSGGSDGGDGRNPGDVIGTIENVTGHDIVDTALGNNFGDDQGESETEELVTEVDHGGNDGNSIGGSGEGGEVFNSTVVPSQDTSAVSAEGAGYEYSTTPVITAATQITTVATEETVTTTVPDVPNENSNTQGNTDDTLIDNDTDDDDGGLSPGETVDDTIEGDDDMNQEPNNDHGGDSGPIIDWNDDQTDDRVAKPNNNGGSGKNQSSGVTTQELQEEERRVRFLSASGLVFAFFAMIFTAYQMSENPDGFYAAMCRFCITVLICIFRIILSPCKGVFGYSQYRHSHYGHVPVSTMDYGYRDPSVELQLQ